MSYENTLTAAGARVIDFAQFGDYQGNWYARVEYDGKIGWVTGSYGSCSGCDAFESEFGYSYADHKHGDRYINPGGDYADFDLTCAQCLVLLGDLAEFGKGYTDLFMTQEQAEAEAKNDHYSWDLNGNEAYDFVHKFATSEAAA